MTAPESKAQHTPERWRVAHHPNAIGLLCLARRIDGNREYLKNADGSVRGFNSRACASAAIAKATGAQP